MHAGTLSCPPTVHPSNRVAARIGLRSRRQQHPGQKSHTQDGEEPMPSARGTDRLAFSFSAYFLPLHYVPSFASRAREELSFPCAIGDMFRLRPESAAIIFVCSSDALVNSGILLCRVLSRLFLLPFVFGFSFHAPSFPSQVGRYIATYMASIAREFFCFTMRKPH